MVLLWHRSEEPCELAQDCRQQKNPVWRYFWWQSWDMDMHLPTLAKYTDSLIKYKLMTNATKKIQHHWYLTYLLQYKICSCLRSSTHLNTLRASHTSYHLSKCTHHIISELQSFYTKHTSPHAYVEIFHISKLIDIHFHCTIKNSLTSFAFHGKKNVTHKGG